MYGKLWMAAMSRIHLHGRLSGRAGMKREAFQKVKGQVGACGIWCGSCIVGNGMLGELTRRYDELIKGYGLESWAPGDFDFGEFKKGLASIAAIPLCPGCLKGGGIAGCSIRSCAGRKKLRDCSECGRLKSCPNKDEIKKMRDGALAAGLMVKLKKGDSATFLKKSLSEIQAKFPCFLLFE